MSENDRARNLEFSYSTDEGLGPKGHIGFIILSNDQTLPYEVHRLLDIPGIAIYESKQVVPVVPDALVTTEILASQKEHITTAASIINARRAPDVVAYGCTSGAMTLGHEIIAAEIHKALPHAKVTDPLLAAMAALRAMDCQNRRLAFISPYLQEVSDNMVSHFTAHGFHIPVVARFFSEGKNPSRDAPFISPQSIAKAILEIGSAPDVDAVFLSCTQMRFVETIEEVEKELGKPVISSNQALCWHALRLVGFDDVLKGYGSLFAKTL